MGACPFCKGEVDDDVLTFGGRCPSCLIEIPGDEAPTDPGAEAKAAEAAAEAAAQKPRLGIIVGALALGLAVLGGAYTVLAPADDPLPEIYTGAENYKRVSSQFLIIDLDEPQVVEAAPTPEKGAQKPTSGSGTKPSETQGSGGKSSATASNRPPAGRSTDAGTNTAKSTSRIPNTADLPDSALDADPGAAVAYADPTAGSGDAYVPPTESAAARDQVEAGMLPTPTQRRKPDLLNADLDAGPTDRGPKGIELCGDQIRDAVKGLMKHMGTKLSSCGDRMLKKDDKFSSAVKVSIAIEPTGKIAAIDLRPSSTDDPEFLSCLEKTIKRTSFPRFCQGVDLAKTYYFGSQR